jgi:hypothetical protein
VEKPFVDFALGSLKTLKGSTKRESVASRNGAAVAQGPPTELIARDRFDSAVICDRLVRMRPISSTAPVPAILSDSALWRIASLRVSRGACSTGEKTYHSKCQRPLRHHLDQVGAIIRRTMKIAQQAVG